MERRVVVNDDKSFIAVNEVGILNLESSKALISKIVEDPKYCRNYKILLNLKSMKFNLSVIDIFDLTSYMTLDNETCACNRGLTMKSFTDYEQAVEWLEVDLHDYSEYLLPRFRMQERK